MASNSLPEKIRRLDPTKLASHPLVRQPSTRGKLIQGKERAPNSKAAKRYREQETVRLRKALKHVTHGKNIFAYNHMRTNQVVYSLTRALNKNNVMNQLINHGKKTIPPNLRKDMWIPYFSLHFPSSSIGLKAYRILRELSVQRQLSPNPETITITKEVLEKSRPRDPLKVEEWDEEWKDRVGHIMDKKRRARVLMDQKATSVADVASTIQWQLEENERRAAKEDGEEGEPKGKKDLSKKALKRLRKVRTQEQQKQNEIKERIASLAKSLGTGPAQAVDIAEPKGVAEYDVPEDEIKVLWADLEDARHAISWPEGVSHGELARGNSHIMRGAKGNKIQPIEISGGKTEQVPEEAAETPREQEPQEEAPSWTKKLKFW